MEFQLVEWNKSHIDGVVKHANNQKIADNLRDTFPFPYTYADAEWYVNDCMEKADSSQIARAIEVDGEVVGSIGIFVKDDVYRKSGELGYWLSEEYWGKGIMSEAVKQICKEAFERFDIVRIFAEPFSYNTGSRRVLEKAGFTLEGILKQSVCKHDKIYDSCMYALFPPAMNTYGR
jgi:[ribosomal protein S5]-alanine N-acetyltransferase